jgi:hypothetical protein
MAVLPLPSLPWQEAHFDAQVAAASAPKLTPAAAIVTAATTISFFIR